MSEMRDKIARLAVLQAIYNKAGEEVSTKDPCSLRSEVDQYFKEQYELTGAKSSDININGVQVGTYSAKFSKPTEEKVSSELVIDDFADVALWVSQMSDKEIRYLVETDLDHFAHLAFERYGEVPLGCHVQKTVTPAKPKQYIGGMLKVDFSQVQKVITTPEVKLLAGD